LLLAAQLACWGMWTYLLLFFQAWRVPRTLSCAGVLLVLGHPAAFFLVAGYTESLFLLSLLGFLWWSGKSGKASALLGAVHGFVLTATRLVGVPLLVFPLLHGGLTAPSPWTGRLRRCTRAILIGILGGAGVAAFLLWCQLELGQWDASLQVSRDGWNI